jgi:hypothetical protein
MKSKNLGLMSWIITVCVIISISIPKSSVWARQQVREALPHYDFVTREEMVPMRDGTKLYTLILTPKNPKRPLPIMLERTPYLHGDEEERLVPVTVFETGINRWRRFDRWPPTDEQIRIYLQPHGGLALTPPTGSKSSTEFVSDPNKPVPYAPRPSWGIDYDNPPSIAAWRRWLVEDQRFVDGRPEVATRISEPLTEPLTVRGPVSAQPFAETTGTDADWVVGFIDVFPYDDPTFEMSGYELMVSADIFRGRYSDAYDKPQPISPNQALAFTIPLPHVNHAFQPVHRITVQVQSTWFPLYDRNPQTFVPTIMSARPTACRTQRHRIHHSKTHATYLECYVDRTN